MSTAWPGGVYASPSIAGSRPGALLAGAWAAMLSMGRQGYLESCKQIVGAAKQIEAGIRENIPELEILGNPKVTVVAFQSETLDVYAVGDKMSERGWHCRSMSEVHIGQSLTLLSSFSKRLAESTCRSYLLHASYCASCRNLPFRLAGCCRRSQDHARRCPFG